MWSDAIARVALIVSGHAHRNQISQNNSWCRKLWSLYYYCDTKYFAHNRIMKSTESVFGLVCAVNGEAGIVDFLPFVRTKSIRKKTDRYTQNEKIYLTQTMRIGNNARPFSRKIDNPKYNYKCNFAHWTCLCNTHQILLSILSLMILFVCLPRCFSCQVTLFFVSRDGKNAALFRFLIRIQYYKMLLLCWMPSIFAYDQSGCRWFKRFIESAIGFRRFPSVI